MSLAACLQPGSWTISVLVVHNRTRAKKFHRDNVRCHLLDTMEFTPVARNRAASVAFVLQSASSSGAIMSQASFGNCKQPLRVSHLLIFAAAMILSPAIGATQVSAQTLGYAPPSAALFATEDGSLVVPPQSGVTEPGDTPASVVPERFRRTIMNYSTREAPGTVIIDTANTTLYYVLGQNRAVRYGVGVGREGFTWSGVQTISRKAEWPDWHPPAEMIARQPYLPRFMAGGPGNPLGARAMYLGGTEYRIHGTNDPSTIGKFVSSGCIRLTNEDVADLFSRVDVGTRVVVLPKSGAPRIEVRGTTAARAASTAPHPVMSTSRPDRQAMNLSALTLY
jgi:lipoprotein-anchoring transpeptidase ErfK/SrfK